MYSGGLFTQCDVVHFRFWGHVKFNEDAEPTYITFFKIYAQDFFDVSFVLLSHFERGQKCQKVTLVTLEGAKI